MTRGRYSEDNTKEFGNIIGNHDIKGRRHEEETDGYTDDIKR